MTKLKNTKKGMAKKALSVSLVAAMLATSNVPVWAAEDLFTDGSSDVAVEAPVVEEEPAAEVEAFSAEPAEVVEDAAPAVDLQAEVSSDMFSVETNFTNVKDNKLAWNQAPQGTIKVTPKEGLDASKLAVKYVWKADGLEISGTSGEIGSNYFGQEINNFNKYTNGEEYVGQNITLFVYAVNTETNEIAWQYTSDSISIESLKLEDLLVTKSDVKIPYNGTSQQLKYTDLFEFKGGAVVNVAESDITLSYSGDTTNVTDAGVTVTLTPKSKKYSGQLTTTYKITPKGLAAGAVSNEMTATLNTNSFIYTGDTVKIKKSDINLVDKDTKEDLSNYLKTDKDGYVSVKASAVNVGKAPVIVELIEGVPATGNKNYSLGAGATINAGEASVTVRDLSTVNATIKNQEYNNGQAIKTIAKEDITFTDKTTGEKLNLYGDVDFVIPEDAGTNTTTYTVTIKGDTANVKGSITATMKVVMHDLSDATFSETISDQEYTGEQITPDVSKLQVKVGNTIVPADQYDIRYGENVNAGKGQIYIVGKNNYEGSQATVEFNITKVAVSSIEANRFVEEIDTRNPADYKDAMNIVVKAKNKAGKEFILTEGTDYTVVDFDFVEDENKKNIGVTARIKLNEEGNFTDGSSMNVTSNLTQAIIRDADIRLKETSYTYTGAPIEPVFDVVVNGRVVNPDYYDYIVSNAVDAGTATLTVTGDGEHYSKDFSAKVNFTITAADAATLTGVIPAQAYTGYSILPVADDIDLSLNGVKIDVYNNFTLSYGENVEMGEGTVTLTPKSGNKNFTGTKTITFKIVADLLNGDKSEIKYYDDKGLAVDKDKIFTYDGTAHTFDKLTFTFGTSDSKHADLTLTEGTDYEIKYVDNIYGKKASDGEQYGAILVVAKGKYGGNYTNNAIGVKDGIYTDANGSKTENVIYADNFKIGTVNVVRSNVAISNGTYAAGLPVKPQVTITVNGKVLVEGQDYDLDFSAYSNEDRVNVTSTKALHVDIVPKNGYRGTLTRLNWGIDKFNLANADVSVDGDTVTVKCGRVDIETSEYTVIREGSTLTVTAVEGSKNYTGSKTINVETEDEKPATPEIQSVNVNGNNATVVLSGEADGATGYDYVISTDRNCITNKDYDKVNKNILSTETTFTYTQQGVYYAYVHAWKRVDGVKVFSDWSEAYPFSVSAITPEQPVITSVKKSGRNLTVTWTQSANATTGYDIVMGTALRKVNGEVRPVEYGKAVKKLGPNTYSVTFRSIPKGTYYVALHAHNRTSETGVKVFSPWSNYKKVTF